ncbi:Six-hairpin glycosidase-like protein [Abortiporus biennis]|nr:Six-hairpin glycosidase-like protein [Abortiporus biennis]
MFQQQFTFAFLFILFSALSAYGAIDRHAIVSRYNPVRNMSSNTTPMQVGNGNFAFGADVTGLQTFLPFAIMSSWGWKNDSLPPNRSLEDIENYEGVSWLSHGRPVQFEFGGVADIQQWLISNPNRVNLGRVGILFLDDRGNIQNITEDDLDDVRQELDLWSGTMTSQFSFSGQKVTVTTSSAQSDSAIAVTVTSSLVKQGKLGIFLDFPWNDGTAKFSAPFVGSWNQTGRHTTSLADDRVLGTGIRAQISHTLDSATFFTSIGGDNFTIHRDSLEEHRYSLVPAGNVTSFSLSIGYSLGGTSPLSSPSSIRQESKEQWEQYWSQGGFIDVASGSTDPRAEELQRRIILSRYLMRVNEAGNTPPQESGLVNDGWYGKFHMEMVFWHLGHWALWGNWELLDRAMGTYQRFLPTSIERAQVQEGYTSGARWSKMTDPSGRSAPGEINELLIWQQPHPLVFAEYDYRAHPSRATLEKWKDVVNETANWMVDFAWFNQSSGFYDLGPPMYVVSEDTSPNVTRNPAFELSYWRFGLDLAETWMNRLDIPSPDAWKEAKGHLAPLPISNGLYEVYEGLEANFWTDPAYINDHPALVGLHGWLPITANVSLDIAKATADRVYTSWNISNCWGWDFPMLAMSAARNGEFEQAVDWLLHPLFKFDDVGMPIGGVRVPTPYFPGSGALLFAVTMMAQGWDGSVGPSPGFPKTGSWQIDAEGLHTAL